MITEWNSTSINMIRLSSVQGINAVTLFVRGKVGKGRETCMQHKSKRGCCGYTVRVATDGPPDATQRAPASLWFSLSAHSKQ